ncbi:MAG: hypothetical protein V3G42_05530 [Oscillospiraceae bacterium]
MLKAVGKFIDTLPLEQLFSQEEHRSDTVTIEIDRYYGEHDMTDFHFIMRGVTESGSEMEAVLDNYESDGIIIHLAWEVGKEFTAEAGLLALDLVAYHYPEGADPVEDEPDVIIRYQLPAIRIRALPDATHPLESHSYTEFLLQVRNAAEENLAEINAIVEQFRYDLNVTQLNERLEALELLTAQLSQELHSFEQRVYPNVNLTQDEYNALNPPLANTLYIIT